MIENFFVSWVHFIHMNSRLFFSILHLTLECIIYTSYWALFVRLYGSLLSTTFYNVVYRLQCLAHLCKFSVPQILNSMLFKIKCFFTCTIYYTSKSICDIENCFYSHFVFVADENWSVSCEQVRLGFGTQFLSSMFPLPYVLK